MLATCPQCSEQYQLLALICAVVFRPQWSELNARDDLGITRPHCYLQYYPPTVNDPKLAAMAARIAAEALGGPEHVAEAVPSMAGERDCMSVHERACTLECWYLCSYVHVHIECMLVCKHAYCFKHMSHLL